jgi:hypothetical protein
MGKKKPDSKCRSSSWLYTVETNRVFFGSLENILLLYLFLLIILLSFFSFLHGLIFFWCSPFF